jgi:formiminoglutamase
MIALRLSKRHRQKQRARKRNNPMIELKDYFDSIGHELNVSRYKKGTYGESVQANDPFKKGADFQIALIGIAESRNAYGGCFDSGNDIIRSYFYNLAEIPRIKIADLGNLKLGKQVKDTYASIKFISEKLLKKQIIPLFFGGSQDLIFPVVEALNEMQQETELTVIDSKLDILDNEFHSNSFLNQIKNKFGKKTLISLLGYQSYFVSNDELKEGYKFNWNLCRLGSVRNNFTQIEPVLRDSCVVSFDISSIRQSESPASSFSSPNGFYADEACQLANLAGLSDKLKVFALAEYQEEKDIHEQSAHLCAQILWHFLYGVSQRKSDYPKKNLELYKKIFVKLEKIDSDLVFYENIENKRFWVEIPMNNNKTKIISCSENDYQKACNNEIPDRIWQNISRYLK